MSIDCVAALGLVQLVFAAVCEASQITNWPGKEPHDACRSHRVDEPGDAPDVEDGVPAIDHVREHRAGVRRLPDHIWDEHDALEARRAGHLGAKAA
eukprot:scaffold803_cov310-Pinguiococcus_pyrenoidosus.AAC.77